MGGDTVHVCDSQCNSCANTYAPQCLCVCKICDGVAILHRSTILEQVYFIFLFSEQCIIKPDN